MAWVNDETPQLCFWFAGCALGLESAIGSILMLASPPSVSPLSFAVLESLDAAGLFVKLPPLQILRTLGAFRGKLGLQFARKPARSQNEKSSQV